MDTALQNNSKTKPAQSTFSHIAHFSIFTHLTTPLSINITTPRRFAPCYLIIPPPCPHMTPLNLRFTQHGVVGVTRPAYTENFTKLYLISHLSRGVEPTHSTAMTSQCTILTDYTTSTKRSHRLPTLCSPIEFNTCLVSRVNFHNLLTQP